MMPQVPVSTVEFGGFPDAPWMRIDGCTYRHGDEFDGRHGFDYGTILRPRLFRIIIALAIARKSDRAVDGGWRSAEEIAVTADTLAPPNGTRRFLWSALHVYTPFREREIEFTRVPDTHLIQYWPLQRTDGVLASGRTRGPYRLGVPPDAITLDLQAGLAFLGHSMVELPADDWTLQEAIVYAQGAAEACDYLTARAALVKGLHRGAMGRSEKERWSLAADAYHLLGQYAVQLRYSEDAIGSSRHARTLFERLRHPLGVVSAFLTAAHAHGQLGNEGDGLFAVRRAQTFLDDTSPRHRGTKRAECAGVAGQQFSRVTNFDAADRSLLRALHLAQDVDDRRQVCLWAVRRAENFLRQRDLSATERTLFEAHDCYHRFAIGGMERSQLWRITASFMVAAGRLDEGWRWFARAKEFAQAHRLENQLVRLRPLMAVVEL